MTAPDWDARYASVPPEDGLFGETANLGLLMALARLREGAAPRSALLIADGDGRNGARLAAEGLRVTATDVSAEATRRAVARDAAAGAPVDRVVEDAEAATAPAARADLSALIYLQGPPALRRRALALAAAGTLPGGALFLEGFAGEGGARPGPLSAAMRWSLAETLGWLAEDAPDLEPLEALDGIVRLDEGPKHRGPARVLRLLLRRPAGSDAADGPDAADASSTPPESMP